MVIDLKRIFVNDNSSEPIECSFDFSLVDYMGSCPLKKPIKVSGKVSNKAGLVGLCLEINYDFEAPCDRCGVDTVRNYSVTVDKSLAPSIEGEDSDSIIIVPDMKLDLYELCYQEVIMSLPMKHLCKKDCKGICEKCGKNLNEGECGCKKGEIDPRLSALADLLNN